MEETPIKFKFIAIQIAEKSLSIVPPDFNASTAVYNFNINIDGQVIAPSKFFVFRINVNINNPDTNYQYFRISVLNYFEIENFEESIKLNNDGLYQIPPSLDATLRPVCISTARGIIFSELRGTYLNNSVMPVIFMDSFKPVPQNQ